MESQHLEKTVHGIKYGIGEGFQALTQSNLKNKFYHVIGLERLLSMPETWALK